MSASIQTTLLLMMSGFLGVESNPKPTPESEKLGWVTVQPFNLSQAHPVFEARSAVVADRCRSEPNSYLVLPTVLYAVHEMFVDGRLVLQEGDPTFQKSAVVTSSPTMSCKLLADGRDIVWRVTGYSPYFARVHDYPQISNHNQLTVFFGETAYIGGAIALFFLAIFTFSILYRKESNKLTAAIITSILGFALYDVGVVAPSFELALPTLWVHKISDIALLTGGVSLVAAFFLEKLCSLLVLRVVAVSALIGLPLILFGSTGDAIQFGTSLPFTAFIAAFVEALYRHIRKRKEARSLTEWVLQLACICIFLFVVNNDIDRFMGLSHGVTLISLGLPFSCLALVLSVNRRIDATYQERDHLRKNLEHEVEVKTQSLKNKTTQLEDALLTIKVAQADLVQSANLASLGTLSAGIAHEINNALNYVNGSLLPFKKMLEKQELSDSDRTKAKALLDLMKQGLELTFRIIQNLKRQASSASQQSETLSLSDEIQGILLLVRGRIPKTIDIKTEIEPGLSLEFSRTSLYQIVMNLVVNASDALEDQKIQAALITVSVSSDPHSVWLSVKDNGPGIRKSIRDRIFDPFFTTKEVGRGTGLGLHIVRSEVEKGGAKLELTSEEGQGAEFKIQFPRVEKSERAA